MPFLWIHTFVESPVVLIFNGFSKKMFKSYLFRAFTMDGHMHNAVCFSWRKSIKIRP